ncbi:hypothetical protein B0H11DRAFT_1957631 [Mycena galericulata]|nr:hypothetical protein B0H11DRAFT_1957631 [Mycena galericulata]
MKKRWMGVAESLSIVMKAPVDLRLWFALMVGHETLGRCFITDTGSKSCKWTLQTALEFVKAIRRLVLLYYTIDANSPASRSWQDIREEDITLDTGRTGLEIHGSYKHLKEDAQFFLDYGSYKTLSVSPTQIPPSFGRTIISLSRKNCPVQSTGSTRSKGIVVVHSMHG